MNIAIFVLLCVIFRLTRRYHHLNAAYFVIHVNIIIICFLIEHINRTVVAISIQYNYLYKS